MSRNRIADRLALNQQSIRIADEGRYVNCYLVTCHRCRTVSKIVNQPRTSRGPGGIPPEKAMNIYNARGWRLGDRQDQDTCPGCVVRENHEREKEKKTMVLQTQKAPIAPAPKIQVVPPAEMSIEDRRVIFAKLNDVYIDAQSGYGDGWSDARVAKDLGVAVAWVSAMREQNFGPERSNAEAEKVLREIAALRKDYAEWETRARAIGSEGQALDLRMTALTRVAERIAKAVAP